MPFGFNMQIPGFQFSPMIWSVCSSNPFHNLNMMWNDSMMKLQCDNLMFQSYTGGLNGGFFSLFGNYDSFIPNMIAQNTFAQFQQQVNNGYYGNFGGGFGGFGGFDNFGWGPYGNNGSDGTNGSNGSGNTVEKKELNTLKTLIGKLKKPECGWTNEMEEAYKEALKKSTDQDKIAALKELIAGIDSSVVTKTILDTPEIKKALEKAGYNFPVSESNGNNDDVDKKKSMEVIHDELSGDTPKVDALWQLIANDGDTKTDNILRNLSVWNSMYPNEKGILGLVASKLPNKDISTWQGAVHNITMQLVNKANEYSDLGSKKKEITELLTKIDNAFEANKIAEAKNLINDMMPKFNELYKELRIKEAQKINKQIRETYKIESISENVILGSTKADLEGEGFTGVSISAPSVEGAPAAAAHSAVTVNHDSIADLPADAQLKSLCDGGLLIKTSKNGIYATKTNSSNADKKFYGVKEGKLVEFVGVKGADEINENTKYKEVEDTEDIENYNNSVARVDRLIDEGKLVRCSDENNRGVILYKSTGKDKNFKGHYHYYVIKNNKLVELNGLTVSKHGYAYDPLHPENNEIKAHISQLKDRHVKEFDDSSIPVAEATPDNNGSAPAQPDKNAEKEAKIAQTVAEVTKNEYEKFSEINSTVRQKFGLKKLNVKGYFKDNNGQYYRYNKTTKKLVHLEGVTSISDKGIITMKDGSKKPCREYESPYNSGKALIESIAGDTSDSEYNTMRRKLSSLETYTLADEIYAFFKGSNDNEAWYQKGFCCDMAKEFGIDDAERKSILICIAQKTKILANALCLDEENSDDAKILEYIDNVISEKWINFGVASQANELDKAIEYLIEKYENGNNSESETDDEDFVDNWEY